MDQTSSLSNNFDFNSQAGVMTLLASIRASTLSTADKNELRDLVFLYTNGGGDASVRITLEQKLATANILKVASSKNTDNKNVPGPVLAFGSSRPSPVFKRPAGMVQVQTQAPAPVAAPAAYVAPAPVVTPTPPIPVAVTPPVQVVPAPIPAAPVYVSPSPVPAPAVSTQAAPVSIPNSSYLERIREIKTAVNSKVGNPVNLVDINNEVGREYMNALLEAMKGLSGGAAGQIDFAMKRLEAAYQAVEVAVAAHSSSNAIASIPVNSSQSVDTSPAPVTAPVAQVASFTPPAFAQPQSTTPTPTPTPVPAPVQAPEVVTSSGSSQSAFQNVTEPSVVPIKEVPKVSGYEIAQTSPVTQTINPSIAEAARVLTPSDLPSASSITVEDDAEGLLTREIDDGLEQLLSDWSLFKKSGLFGTGPKGREHPLFKKLAELQIPLLLSGRFEGSSQDIKQSITDYMNGWRYEQGIIYEQGETFEHYLRRVIRQILNLQKKRRPG